MSFLGDAVVEVVLDAANAEKEFAAFLRGTAKQPATVKVGADTKDVRPQIEKAVQSARTTASVEADTRGVPQAIEGAVSAADTLAQIEADARGVPGAIESAVDRADANVAVEADASRVVSRIQAALDASNKVIPIAGDTGPMTANITSALDRVRQQALVNVPVNADTGPFRAGVEGAVDDVARQVDVPVQASARGFEAASQRIAQLESQGQGAARSIIDAFNITPGKIAGAIGTAVVLAGAQYNALVQRTTAAFETLLGSADAANAKVQEIVEFAQTSPFPRQVFLQATQQLIGFGLEAERVTEVLGAVQDATAAVGGDAHMISEITEVLAEIISTGNISAETLNMLGQRGIDAASLIGSQMGMTGQQIRESITDGSLGAQEAFDGLVAGMQEQFGGAAANVKETWVGAVDRIKAAVRDMGSAIVEPFISTGGGGAAVEFANDLADSLRRLEELIVPVAAQISGNLAPSMRAVGRDLIPALVEAFVALTPALGAASEVLVALAPLISGIAKAIALIPDPLLTMVGAWLLFRRALGPLGGLLNGVWSLMARLVPTGRALQGAMNQAGAGAGGLMSKLTLANAALAAGVAVFAGWSGAQARAKQAAAELETQTKGLADAVQSTEGPIEGITEKIREMVAENEDFLVSLGKFGNVGIDVGGALQTLGLTTDEFTRLVEQGDGAVQAYTERLADGSDGAAAAAGAVQGLSEDFQKGAEAALEAGVANGDWTESERDAAIAATEAGGNTRSYVAALESLKGPLLEAEAAAEAEAQAMEDAATALGELIGIAPQVGAELASIDGGLRDATVGMIGFADQAFRAGASEEAITAAADQLGVDAHRWNEFVEGMGQHLEDLRQDILEGIPPLDDVFADPELGQSPRDYARQVRDNLAMITQQIEDFSPNLDALIPWPNLRDRAAREGPAVAGAYAEIARSGNTALLDETEQGIVDHDQALIGLTENVNFWAPGFQSSLGVAAFLGSTEFNNNFNPDAQTSLTRLRDQIVSGPHGGPGVAFAAGEAASMGENAFGQDFNPSAAPGMAGAEGDITGAQPTVAGAASNTGEAASTQFEGSFNPDISAELLTVSEQISGWGVPLNGILAMMGAGAAGAFETNFTPDVSAIMVGLSGQISGWSGVINGTMALMGGGAASSFERNFTPNVSGTMEGLSTGISGWAPVINGTMTLMGDGAENAFEGAFSPETSTIMEGLNASVSSWAPVLNGTMTLMGQGASNAFLAAFHPNPQPALTALINWVLAAQTRLLQLMRQMATFATRDFGLLFRPNPQPALANMLNIARSYIEPMRRVGEITASRFVSAMASVLSAGTGRVEAIVSNYVRALANGLNPILQAVGKPRITFENGGIAQFFARGGIVEPYADGGVREKHVAQIAPAGAMRVWAEPETGGEAYIPLARSKAPRSRKIATETVRRLGGDVQWFARGGVTGDTQGLDPRFFQRLYEWSQALGRVFNVTSGYRSIAEQVVLYRRYLAGQGNLAAVPGSSMHNYGLAADGPHWAGFGPGRHGLTYRVPGEPWHVEPFEAREWARGLPGTGMFAELPKPPAIDGMTGAVADTARAAMQHVYNAAVDWSTTAFEGMSAGIGKIGASGPAVDIGRRMAAARGWTGAQWQALYNLWQKESGWNPLADNPNSSAYGIPQALPGSKMASHGADWRTNPATQIGWGLDYISGRYGNPMAAWAHSQRHNWYRDGAIVHQRSFDDGGVLRPGWNVVRNDTGSNEELIRNESGNIVFAEGAVQVTLNYPTTRQEARLIGRQIGRGAREALSSGRKVQTQAMLAGSAPS